MTKAKKDKKKGPSKHAELVQLLTDRTNWRCRRWYGVFADREKKVPTSAIIGALRTRVCDKDRLKGLKLPKTIDLEDYDGRDELCQAVSPCDFWDALDYMLPEVAIDEMNVLTGIPAANMVFDIVSQTMARATAQVTDLRSSSCSGSFCLNRLQNTLEFFDTRWFPLKDSLQTAIADIHRRRMTIFFDMLTGVHVPGHELSIAIALWRTSPPDIVSPEDDDY